MARLLATALIFAFFLQHVADARMLRATLREPHEVHSAEATANESTAGESTVGESRVGESTAHTATAGESTVGESREGESTAHEATAGESTAGDADENHTDIEIIDDVAQIAEDLETRLRSPGNALDANFGPEDLINEMKDCMLVHMYAEPFQVMDAVHVDKADVNLSRRLDVLTAPGGAVYDSEAAGSNKIALSVEMYAHLDGVSGQVVVLPTGPVARWSSKQKVPIAGYLCNHNGKEDSAPVLHTLPTPCVPTVITSDGSVAGPEADGYDVFIGSTRITFNTKAEAESFCLDYAIQISADLKATVWDASKIGETLQQKNPSLTSFVSMTRQLTSPGGWTTGKKKLLVVVMDWKVGDNTKAPYSKQDDSSIIAHYRDTIFPVVVKKFDEMSYGAFKVEFTVLPQIMRYTRERIRYATNQMPFPALYDAAKAVVEGARNDYMFDDYDLVFVIAPQVEPIGTKGVAWVGKKGAMCNGCEAISDNFKIMVAVHELGHNLGLFHASSNVLEYGNPFDWMGNYPEVKGLNFGVGYLNSLGWISDDLIYQVGDSSVSGMSTEVTLTPFDAGRQVPPGSVAGVKIRLKGNARDLWVAFRSSPESSYRGVFLTWQEREQANSELIDTACHSPSQQDAHLHEGWTFLETSRRVAVKTLEVKETYAKIIVFEVKANEVADLYSDDLFTDGVTKCPVTCQDADWLMTSYTCKDLKEKKYCSGGEITMLGNKWSIGTQLCPQECGSCPAVLRGSTLMSDTCEDKNIVINGKKCPAVAAAGWCSSKTSSGQTIGKDICAKSCGTCPRKITPSGASFAAPAPTKRVGDGETAASAPTQPADAATQSSEAAAQPTGDPEAPATPASPPETPEASCKDDETWTDVDGDSCAKYESEIKAGRMAQDFACAYNDGAAKKYCRKTCNTCEPTSGTCADVSCVGMWMKSTGRCYQCKDHPKYCDMSASFKADCPLTCGVCTAHLDEAKQVENLDPLNTTAPICEDQAEAMTLPGGFKITCKRMGKRFCSRKKFASRCPDTCGMCPPDGVALEKAQCVDIFSDYTCKRYAKYGWCDEPDMKDRVRKGCPQTCKIKECDFEHIEVANHSDKHHSHKSNADALRGGLASLLLAAIVIVSA